MPKSTYSDKDREIMDAAVEERVINGDEMIIDVARDLADQLGHSERGISLYMGRRKAYLKGNQSHGKRGRPRKKPEDTFDKLRRIKRELEELESQQERVRAEIELRLAERQKIVDEFNRLADDVGIPDASPEKSGDGQ